MLSKEKLPLTQSAQHKFSIKIITGKMHIENLFILILTMFKVYSLRTPTCHYFNLYFPVSLIEMFRQNQPQLKIISKGPNCRWSLVQRQLDYILGRRPRYYQPRARAMLRPKRTLVLIFCALSDSVTFKL